ncbi:MAG: PIG-L deacetylase family protein [Armatimonadota bacterium]
MLKRILAISIYILGAVALGLFGAGAKTTVSVYLENQKQQNASFPILPHVRPGDRLLVVAPHPDDETLGCGGLIQQAASSGASILVVILTNGDAFPACTASVTRKITLKPDDYILVGGIRQRESLAALSIQGVPKTNVVFLGYPDRGLLDMWTANWSTAKTGRYTRVSHVPYDDVLSPNAPYTGLSLLSDLAHLILKFEPTILAIPHPNDDHPDHQAAGCFAVAALEAVRSMGKFPDPPPTVLTYIVHRGDWPVPQGLKDRRLVPPKALANLDTKWFVLPLSREQRMKKLEAVRTYRSQISLPNERRFLLSFVRRNELFGSYPWIEEAETGSEHSPPSISWVNILDPTDDSVKRDFQPAADIAEVSLRRQEKALELRMITKGRLAPWITYVFQIRSLRLSNAHDSRYERIVIGPNTRSIPNGGTLARRGNSLLVRIPADWFGNEDCFMICGNTKIGQLTLDRTAWRAIRTSL